jgi:ferrous iron transport protein B
LIGKEARIRINEHIDKIEAELDEETDILVADSRYGLINWITKETVKKTVRVSRTLSDKIDQIVLNRALGIPIFMAAMYLTFMLTINVGGAFIDFFDIFAGTIFVDGPEAMRGMLEQWIRKGRVSKMEMQASCNISCSKCCSDSAMEIYEWTN